MPNRTEPRSGSKSSLKGGGALSESTSSLNANSSMAESSHNSNTNNSLISENNVAVLSRLRSIPSIRPPPTHTENDHNTTDPLIHLPSQQLLNSTYNMSLRSPRIINSQTGSSSTGHINDFFQMAMTPATPTDDQHSLLGRPSLLRQQSLQQTSLYGSIGVPGASADDSKIDDTIFEVNDTGNGASDDESLVKTNFYDDFTTIDWLDNSIKQSERLSHLIRLGERSWHKRILKNFDNAKSWILIMIISFLCACLLYSIDMVENVLIDLKRGYCVTNWVWSENVCCTNYYETNTAFKGTENDQSETMCPNFKSWSEFFPSERHFSFDFVIYLLLTLFLAFLAVQITLLTKTTNPLLSSNDDDDSTSTNNDVDKSVKKRKYNHKVWYTAYGSGVPEVKTILSGFVIRKFLGTWTLVCKLSSLVLAIASGMALGKEGPYVHLSACIGNICCRIFDKINSNDLEKRQILSASASAGVALAFGSPLGAVLFSIEEVTYYLPINQLFHIFICAMSSTLFLKFLNPYGTGKTVLFEVEYSSDWEPIELVFFIFIGIAGGLFGAGFCLFTQWWSKNFRSLSWIKDKPVLEVLLIAALTAMTTFYNKYTKIPTTELLYLLASPCTITNSCPILENKQLSDAGGITLIRYDRIWPELNHLLWALVIKLGLTSITFGLKLPAGIYVPSMTIGALFGRLFAAFLQYLVMSYPQFSNLVFSGKSLLADDNDLNVTCVDFGIYAMIGAGAFMAGVTRMNVTLAAILFELTSSYTYVLPISIAIAISNWVANMIEPYSLYELLILKNDFPFLDNRSTPVFLDKNVRLIDLIPETLNLDYVIDISESPFYPVSVLKSKLRLLQQNSLLDGCLSVVKNHGDTVVGLIPAPVLEFQLDKLANFCREYSITDEIMIKLGKSEDDDDSDISDLFSNASEISSSQLQQEEIVLLLLNKLTDFTTTIDYNPIYLDYDSKLSLVYSIFSKLGIREICVLDEDGKFCGTMHKKVFIDYCKKQKGKY